MVRIGGEKRALRASRQKGRAHFLHLTLGLFLLCCKKARSELCAASNSRGAGSEFARFSRAHSAACSAPALAPRPRAPLRCYTARTRRFVAARAPRRELQPRSDAAALLAPSASCCFAPALRPAPSAGPCSPPAPFLPRPSRLCAGAPGPRLDRCNPCPARTLITAGTPPHPCAHTSCAHLPSRPPPTPGPSGAGPLRTLRRAGPQR